MLNMEDLRAVLAEVGGAGAPKDDDEESARVTNRDLGERMESLEGMLASLMTALNIAPPPEMEAPAAEESPVPVPGEELALPDPAAGGDPLAGLMAGGGLPMPEGGAALPKTASQPATPMTYEEKLASNRTPGQVTLLAMLKQMNK
jgi:hypothetical protein